METVNLKMVAVFPGENITLSYACPHCCAEGKMIQEEQSCKLIPLIAKGIVQYAGVKYPCGNCGEQIILTGDNIIKNTLKPWLNYTE